MENYSMNARVNNKVFNESVENILNNSNCHMNATEQCNISLQMTPNIVRSFIVDQHMEIVTKVFSIGIIPAILVFGIFGNILAPIVFWRQRSSGVKIILITLNFADLLFLVASALSNILTLYAAYDPINGKIIKLKTLPYFQTYVCNILGSYGRILILIVAIERFIAVVFPLKVKTIFSKRFTILLLATAFLSVTAILAPMLFSYNVVETRLPHGELLISMQATEFRKNTLVFNVYYTIVESLLRFTPIILVFIFNLTIVICLKRYMDTRRSLGQKSKGINDLQITKMLLTVSVVFLVCLTPGAIFIFTMLFDPKGEKAVVNSNFHKLIFLLMTFLEILNSSINVFIYVLMNTSFKDQVKGIFCHRKPKQRGTDDLQIEVRDVRRGAENTQTARCET